MTDRTSRYLLVGGAVVMAAFMVVVLFFGVLEKRLAEDNSPAVRREIVRIMARLGTRDAKRVVSSRISDEDAGVRQAFGQAFSAAGNAVAGPNAPGKRE